MIIFRYLVREVLGASLAVCMVLLLIVVSARFVKYLAEAAAGSLDTAVLLQLMMYRLPTFLELIIPLALVLGILLAYGRLYLDNEMTVLYACGMSERRLIGFTLCSATIVALVVGVFSLYLGPKSAHAAEILLLEQRNRTDFETLKPMRFHKLDSGAGVSYAQSISEDNKQLRNVFMATTAIDADNNAVALLTADTGETIIDPDTGHKFLLLRNGRRYLGKPGDANYRIVEFSTWSQQLPEPDFDAIKPKKPTDGLSTTQLLNMQTSAASAALQWRISLPVLVIIVALLAVPLSRTEPRMGRYSRLLPAMLLYFFYVVSVYYARGSLEEGTAPHPAILWFIHLGFFCFAVLLWQWKAIFRRRNRFSDTAAVTA